MISDTHGFHRDLVVPRGHILLFAGDFSNRGLRNELEVLDFNEWARTLDFKHKILICGNHDLGFESSPNFINPFLSSFTVLDGSGTTVEGIKIWGEPRTPSFGVGWEFQCERDKTYDTLWSKVPDDTDILLTHGPPQGILDRNSYGKNVGDKGLRKRMGELDLLHLVCGHIHECGGRGAMINGTKVWNAAVLDHKNNLHKNRGIQTFEISKR